MKGTVARIGSLTGEHDERVQALLEQFIAEIGLLSADERDARNIFLGDRIVVSFVVEDLVDQTPRSGAGGKLW